MTLGASSRNANIDKGYKGQSTDYLSAPDSGMMGSHLHAARSGGNNPRYASAMSRPKKMSHMDMMSQSAMNIQVGGSAL